MMSDTNETGNNASLLEQLPGVEKKALEQLMGYGNEERSDLNTMLLNEIKDPSILIALKADLEKVLECINQMQEGIQSDRITAEHLESARAQITGDPTEE